MGTTQIINLTLDSLCLVILATLLISLCASEDIKTRLGRIFAAIFALSIGGQACAIVANAFDGSSAPNALQVAYISNFLLFFLYDFLRYALAAYIFTHISLKANVSRWCWVFAGVVTAAGIVVLIASQPSGALYYFDTSNRYQHGEWYGLVFFSSALLYPLELFLVIKNRKTLGWRDVVTLVVFELIPAIAVLAPIPAGIYPLNTAATISLLILYARIQLEQGKRLRQREAELAEARVDVMLSQIQPHFVYNTLNTISNLVETSPQQARMLIHDFSSYLRQNMDSLRMTRLVPLADELEHVNLYLKIEKARFGQRLAVCYNLAATGFMVPVLTVQPLVENAVRHGVTKQKEGGTVTIATRQTETGIEIIVSDDGVGFDVQTEPNDGRTHVGISNVRRRLWAQCGGRLDIVSTPGGGTVATITIPRERSEGQRTPLW